MPEALHRTFARELTRHPFFEKGRIVVSAKSKKHFRINRIGRALDTGPIVTKLEPYPADMTPGALAEKFLVPFKDKRDIVVVALNEDGRLLIGRAHEPGELVMPDVKTKQDERTSIRIAKIAARGIKDPASLTDEEIRSLAASALTQTPDHVKKAAGVE